MKAILLSALLLAGLAAKGQVPGVLVLKDVVILQSTPDYAAALASAKEAAVRLHRPLELAGNQPNKKLGLSLSKKACAAGGLEYPCYTPKGQGAAENSEYISVEFSDGYAGFAKGYYLVVAALASPQSPSSRQALARIRRVYPAAYTKRTNVFFGCMY